MHNFLLILGNYALCIVHYALKKLLNDYFIRIVKFVVSTDDDFVTGLKAGNHFKLLGILSAQLNLGLNSF